MFKYGAARKEMLTVQVKFSMAATTCVNTVGFALLIQQVDLNFFFTGHMILIGPALSAPKAAFSTFSS